MVYISLELQFWFIPINRCIWIKKFVFDIIDCSYISFKFIDNQAFKLLLLVNDQFLFIKLKDEIVSTCKIDRPEETIALVYARK